TVASGVVYVSSEAGQLYAFPTTCGSGGATCQPLWRGQTGGNRAVAPAVGGGFVWDTSSGSLYAFPASCTGSCSPALSSFRPGGKFISSDPVVSGGLVYFGTSDGVLYALPTACASARSCEPEWFAKTQGAIAA